MDIVVRAFFAFLFVILVTRVIGRRELSSLQPFDLILLIVLGDLIQQGVTQSDYSFTGLVLAGGTFTVLTVAVSYLVFRFRPLRPVFEAEPLILVEDGKPVDRNLRRERMTIEEVAAEARLQQIPSLQGSPLGRARVERQDQLHPASMSSVEPQAGELTPRVSSRIRKTSTRFRARTKGLLRAAVPSTSPTLRRPSTRRQRSGRSPRLRSEGEPRPLHLRGSRRQVTGRRASFAAGSARRLLTSPAIVASRSVGAPFRAVDDTLPDQLRMWAESEDARLVRRLLRTIRSVSRTRASRARTSGVQGSRDQSILPENPHLIRHALLVREGSPVDLPGEWHTGDLRDGRDEVDRLRVAVDDLSARPVPVS